MAQEQGGMGGGIWGSLIDGIFDSVGKAQDMDAANQDFDRAMIMRKGAYDPKSQDVIIFVGLLLILGLVIIILK